MGGIPSRARIIDAAMGLWRGPATRQALWLTVPFGLQQAIRLFNNVVLAYLLAPEIFGVMLLINTLRTGTELLSDVGVGQSVVRSPHAKDRTFLDSAFTVQLVRGIILMVLALLAAWPIAEAYGNPELVPVICLVSIVFLMTGLQSPDLFLMQRDMRVVHRGIYDLVGTVINTIVTIGLAWWLGNVWALVWGLVINAVVTTLLSYAFAPFRLPRLTWHSEHSAEILHFGKWIFLSTALYFAAISTDKIYFSAVLPLALVGIYGVARTFSDMLTALAQRLGSFLVFPRVVELRERRDEAAPTFQRKRRIALAMIAAATAVAIAVSDQLILLLYDTRYHAAAFMLPVLMAGVWFAVLGAFGEAKLFGLDRPRSAAVGNAVKFAILIVGLPLLVPTQGVFAGLLVLLAAEAGRWLALSIALRHERLASIGDDLVLTVLIVALALVLKLLLAGLGLVPDFQQWWALGNGVHN